MEISELLFTCMFMSVNEMLFELIKRQLNSKLSLALAWSFLSEIDIIKINDRVGNSQICSSEAGGGGRRNYVTLLRPRLLASTVQWRTFENPQSPVYVVEWHFSRGSERC